MNLRNDCYYKTQAGLVVRVQAETGGLLSAYNVQGDRIHQCAEQDHVNGWTPCSKNEFDEARKEWQEQRAAQKAETRKPKKKKRKTN